jgi:tetratricopeptide (TPR) repeat protein
MVPDNHPDYVFAYHSAAVANMLSDNIAGAIADLEQVIQFRPQNKAQEEMINRSYVFLGFLYYEDLSTEGALARAVTALRTVPRGSYYYQDALLGLGWTALKARQWSDCIAVGSELARSSTDPILQSEGDLIAAYAHAQQRNWGPALNLLEGAVRRLNAYSGPSESEMGQRRTEYGGNRADYEQMGLRIDELGQARQSSIIQNSIDSLNTPHVRLKGSIDQFYKSADEHQRAVFFARSHEQVKEDVDYALARFSRHAGSRDMQRQLQRTTGEADAIDEELERLRRELEGLD